MGEDKKQIIQIICAVAGMALGTFLIVMGMLSEPIGVLDSSVNIALGEVLTFVGSIIGIDYNYKKHYNEVMKLRSDNKE